jgi:hypothetical protein
MSVYGFINASCLYDVKLHRKDILFGRRYLQNSEKAVIHTKAGVDKAFKILDSRIRGNDILGGFTIGSEKYTQILCLDAPIILHVSLVALSITLMVTMELFLNRSAQNRHKNSLLLRQIKHIANTGGWWF